MRVLWSVVRACGGWVGVFKREFCGRWCVLLAWQGFVVGGACFWPGRGDAPQPAAVAAPAVDAQLLARAHAGGRVDERHGRRCGPGLRYPATWQGQGPARTERWCSWYDRAIQAARWQRRHTIPARVDWVHGEGIGEGRASAMGVEELQGSELRSWPRSGRTPAAHSGEPARGGRTLSRPSQPLPLAEAPDHALLGTRRAPAPSTTRRRAAPAQAHRGSSPSMARNGGGQSAAQPGAARRKRNARC